MDEPIVGQVAGQRRQEDVAVDVAIVDHMGAPRSSRDLPRELGKVFPGVIFPAKVHRDDFTPWHGVLADAGPVDKGQPVWGDAYSGLRSSPRGESSPRSSEAQLGTQILRGSRDALAYLWKSGPHCRPHKGNGQPPPGRMFAARDDRQAGEGGRSDHAWPTALALRHDLSVSPAQPDRQPGHHVRRRARLGWRERPIMAQSQPVVLQAPSTACTA